MNKNFKSTKCNVSNEQRNSQEDYDNELSRSILLAMIGLMDSSHSNEKSNEEVVKN